MQKYQKLLFRLPKVETNLICENEVIDDVRLITNSAEIDEHTDKTVFRDTG